MNKYYLKNKGIYSEMSSEELRSRFEEYSKRLGYKVFTRGMKNTYEDPELQARYEGYSNGFRQGEDYIQDEKE